MLVVIILVGLAAGMALPRFVSSFEASQLRYSVQTIVRMHNHARNLAIVEQQPTALLFNEKSGRLRLVAVRVPDEDRARAFLELPPAGMFDRQRREIAGNGRAEPQIEEKAERALENGIRITEFETQFTSQQEDGVYWINFWPNGTCDAYTIRIEDIGRERGATLRAEGVTGRIEAEYD